MLNKWKLIYITVFSSFLSCRLSHNSLVWACDPFKGARPLSELPTVATAVKCRLHTDASVLTSEHQSQGPCFCRANVFSFDALSKCSSTLLALLTCITCRITFKLQYWYFYWSTPPIQPCSPLTLADSLWHQQEQTWCLLFHIYPFLVKIWHQFYHR